MKRPLSFALYPIISIILFTACAPAASESAEIPVDAVPGVTANAGELTRLTSFTNEQAQNSHASPNGQLVLVSTSRSTSVGNESNVLLIDTDKPEQQRPLAGPGAAQAAWFPDGDTIVYVNEQTSQPQLVKTAVSGAGVTFIGNNPFGQADGAPDISHDGEKIVFSTRFGNTATLATVNTDGTEFTTYVEGDNPRWSPDDSMIVFDRATTTAGRDIFVLDLASGAVTQLTSDTSDNRAPSWSPDGTQIVFQSDRVGGADHIFTMSADGSNVVQLTQGNSSNRLPAWASDNFIYFNSNAGSSRQGVRDIWRLVPNASPVASEVSTEGESASEDEAEEDEASSDADSSD